MNAARTKRCRCGNADREPRVTPFPIMFVPVGMKDAVALPYNAGFDQHGKCWFCSFRRDTEGEHRR